MSSDTAIKVEGLSKCYQIYDKPRDRLMQMLMRGRKQYFREFWALRNVSFELNRGETVGIIGLNGSGKSTLLQMICGTLNPTSGSVTTKGRVAALLELGAGFNPEFTGRENVYLAASLYGLTTKDVDARFDAITDFADIGDFIDQPVKTYSSGMFVRLAFAVIAHVDADILVIDEALSVGDAYFVQKCMRFLRDFMEHGTLLFCSHDTGAIVNLCSKAILLKRGQIAAIGTPKEVTEHYLAALYETAQGDIQIDGNDSPSERTIPETDYRDMRLDMLNSSTLRNDIEIFKFKLNDNAFGTGRATISTVRLLDHKLTPLSWIVGGEDAVLEIRCQAKQRVVQPIIGFQFKDRLGQVVFADNTFLTHKGNTLIASAGTEIIARFSFRMPILPSGDYSIGAALAEGSQDTHVQHHWMHDALIVRVHASSTCFGLIAIPMRNITLDIQ